MGIQALKVLIYCLSTKLSLVALVHRRTGGLEISQPQRRASISVHRRTGGLESRNISGSFKYKVHRRTGGLESKPSK